MIVSGAADAKLLEIVTGPNVERGILSGSITTTDTNGAYKTLLCIVNISDFVL